MITLIFYVIFPPEKMQETYEERSRVGMEERAQRLQIVYYASDPKCRFFQWTPLIRRQGSGETTSRGL